jgi:predicted enzyme related to lactoylglutathione lyase
MHGQFSWYELYTADTAAAQKFYSRVAGWKAEPPTPSAGGDPYFSWTADGTPVAGMMKLKEEWRSGGMTPQWMPYIDVNDVDEIVRQATAAGGKLQWGPYDLPQVGRFAGLADPQGAPFAVIKSTTPGPSFDGTPVPGRFSWHELLTSDYEAAFDFYRRLFGWENQQEMDMGPDGKYRMYGLRGKMYGGMYNKTRESQSSPRWLCYVAVADAAKAAAAASSVGGRTTSGPMQVPGGDWVAMLVDPQGAAFAVHERARQAAGKTAAKKATSKKASKKTSKKTSKKASKKASRKAVKRTAKRSAKKSARKAPRRAARKGARKRKR